jgi:hypothetical protein
VTSLLLLDARIIITTGAGRGGRSCRCASTSWPRGIAADLDSLEAEPRSVAHSNVQCMVTILDNRCPIVGKVAV